MNKELKLEHQIIDALGNIVVEGDIIFQTKNNKIGRIHGGLTPGGKIRFINVWGGSENAHTCDLIKITKEQATVNLIEEKRDAQEEVDYIKNNLEDGELLEETIGYDEAMDVIKFVDLILEED